MNYQKGDYIRFHTPEQWQQVTDKLERDGQRVLTNYDERDTNVVFVDTSPSGWYSYDGIDIFCQNDITNKFFEEILQEELCSNPPLEVGDVFVVKWYNCEKEFTFKKLPECNYYDTTLVNDLGGTEHHTCKYGLEKLLNQGTVKILSYKQANPVQEFSVKPKKRLISLSGKACPRYYRLEVDNEELKELLDQGFKTSEDDGWYFVNRWYASAPYRVEIDMADKTIYANRYIISKKRSIAIKTIKSSEGVLDLDGSLEKLDMISDSEHSMLFAEALNEEEYQKWLKCVESHHKMMLEVEKGYRAECFKVIESLK